jgi:hypothetical protein
MPSAQYTTRVLSTPQISVNGQVWPIIPNSLTVRIPGEAKVRAVSVGGGGVQSVFGIDATNLIAHVRFMIANTAQNYDRVRAVKAAMVAQNTPATLHIADPDEPLSFQNMLFSKDTEASWKADGDIPVEFEGDWVQ